MTSERARGKGALSSISRWTNTWLGVVSPLSGRSIILNCWTFQFSDFEPRFPRSEKWITSRECGVLLLLRHISSLLHVIILNFPFVKIHNMDFITTIVWLEIDLKIPRVSQLAAWSIIQCSREHFFLSYFFHVRKRGDISQHFVGLDREGLRGARRVSDKSFISFSSAHRPSARFYLKMDLLCAVAEKQEKKRSSRGLICQAFAE